MVSLFAMQGASRRPFRVGVKKNGHPPRISADLLHDPNDHNM